MHRSALGFEIQIGDVVMQPADTRAERVIPDNVGKIVDNLILEHAPSLREKEAGGKRRLTESANGRKRVSRESEERRQRSQCAAGIRRHEDGRIKEGGTIELVYGVGAERVDFRHLPGHLGLVAFLVKRRTERAGESGLEPVVAQDPDIAAVLIAEIVIDAARPLVLLVRIGRRGAEPERAGYAGRQTCKTLATACDRCRRADPWRAVVDGENLFVERDLVGVAVRSEVSQSRGLELRAGNQREGAGGGQDVAQAFIIHVEERAVLPDRSADTRGPLIEIVERRGRADRVAEELVRVHGAPVPHVVGFSVKLVGPRLGDVGDLRTGVLTVLRRVRAVDHVNFLDVVGAEQQVGSAAVIDAEKRIVIVLSVDAEKIGGGRHSIRHEVAVTGLRVHDDAGRGLGDIGDIAAGVGQVADQLAVERGSDIGVLSLNSGSGFDDVHRLGGFGKRQLYIDGRGLPCRDREVRALLGLKTTGVDSDLPETRRNECKPVISFGVRGCRTGCIGIDAGQCDGGVGNRGAAGVGHDAGDIAGSDRLSPGYVCEKKRNYNGRDQSGARADDFPQHGPILRANSGETRRFGANVYDGAVEPHRPGVNERSGFGGTGRPQTTMACSTRLGMSTSFLWTWPSLRCLSLPSWARRSDGGCPHIHGTPAPLRDGWSRWSIRRFPGLRCTVPAPRSSYARGHAVRRVREGHRREPADSTCGARGPPRLAGFWRLRRFSAREDRAWRALRFRRRSPGCRVPAAATKWPTTALRQPLHAHTALRRFRRRRDPPVRFRDANCLAQAWFRRRGGR